MATLGGRMDGVRAVIVPCVDPAAEIQKSTQLAHEWEGRTHGRAQALGRRVDEAA